MIINARERGIEPGTDISRAFLSLTEELSGIDGEKELVIEPGEYYLTAQNCKKDMLFITNTVGDGEFSDGETPHEARVGLYFKDIDNLTVSAQGAVFLLSGKMTNCAIINCNGFKLIGAEIRPVNPDEHEFTVIKKSPFSVTVKLDDESSYVKDGKEFYFTGADYKTPFYENRTTSWGWFGKIFADNQEHIRREKHPFFGAYSIKEVSPRVFKLGFFGTRRFTLGERHCVFNTRRQYAGIFIDRSKDVELNAIHQCYNYSLAIVAQDSENLTIDGVTLAPSEKQDKKLCSLADFIQVCMCRGEVRVTDSFFCGAGDDCLNVHGIHFKIISVADNKIVVRFMHAQSHGFNPLRAGDTLEYVSPDTLLPVGEAKITGSVLLNETDIELTVDSLEQAKTGLVIEDTSACPDLIFKGNKLTRIITRGLLITTRGRVTVEDNDFFNTEMAALLFSDDAKNWYESGRCADVTIKNNRFHDCGAQNILVLPENGRTKSVVHGSFTITGNSFLSTENGGIDIHSAQSVEIAGNKGITEGFVKCDNVSRISVK